MGERKLYTLSLDSENVERIKIVLKDRGITFSGFVDAQISEVLNILGRDKAMGDMKMKDAIKMMTRMVKILEAPKK